MTVIFDHSADTALHIKTFYFKKPAGFRYTAGQFIELTLPHENPDERGIKHWFTLSSSPTEEFLSITTKLAERSSSFKQTLQALKSGDEVQMSDVMGDFVLPKDKTIPLIFVAGGIGVTPMHSMIQWLADTGEQREITLLYAANSHEEMAFLPLFSSYPLKFIPLVRNTSTEFHEETGQLTSDRVLNLAKNTSNSLIYLSGPEPMVETFVDEIKKAGVAEHRLVTDYFPNYSATY